MDEPQIQELSSIQPSPAHKITELVSIRTKLAAPNNLLPGTMIRSQPPLHLLPVQLETEAESGYQMLLDQVVPTVSELPSDRRKNKRLKNVSMKVRKTYSKSEISQNKDKQKDRSLEPVDQRQLTVQKEDPLAFLNKMTKNIHRYLQQLVFVSKTVLLGSGKTSNIVKTRNGSQEQVNKMYVKKLMGMQNYGAVPFEYDNMGNDHYRQLPDFVADRDSNDLLFDDNFQSSNLLTASKINKQSYQCLSSPSLNETYLLTVRLDYNTRSYGQWFYFRVTRRQRPFSFERRPKNLYKFMLVNMTKSSSMFGLGLKVSVCRNGVWRKEGTEIKYYQNSLKRDQDYNPQATLNANSTTNYCTLEFTLEIYEGQELYISYTEPYTFSRVGKLLDRVTNTYETNKKNIINIKRYVICTTYLGNNIEALNFTAKNQEDRSEQKKIIFIISRCHPVETAGSHVLEGVINTISQLFIDCTIEEQKSHMLYKLLENYVIKIIPMLNPDGVILGNSRCNIAGYDMNRSWRNPQPDRCRQIHAVKRYILGYEKRIAMFIDLHAHSKKKNVFAYGCHDTSNPFATREFPYLLSKLSQNDFLFSECRFAKLSKVSSDVRRCGKDGTARVFLYDVLRIPNVFTIENSYCSARDSMFHYDKAAYQVIGSDILHAISLYFSPSFKMQQYMPVSYHTHFEEDCETPDQRDKISKTALSHLSHRESALKLSVRSSRNELKELKIAKSNSGKEEAHHLVSSNKKTKNNNEKWNQAINLRQQYIHELKSTEKNITIGLTKDQASESQDQQRIYEALPPKSQEHLSKKNKKKNSRKTQRLVNYLNKTRRQNVGSKLQKDKSPNEKKQILNISSTHSQISLQKHHRTIRPHKFYTARKGQIYESIEVEQEDPESPVRRTHHSRAKRINTEASSIHQIKQQKLLSIIDIGTIDRNMTTHNYRFNLAQKVDHKYHSKPLPQDKIIYREPKFQGEDSILLNKRREEEIKQYLRKLVRPRQIIERRQKLAIRQRNEKQQLKIKQSSIQFSNVKLTRLLVQQGISKAARNETDMTSK